MNRLKKIFLVSMALAVWSGFGWNIDTSHAHPSGHSHKHVFSSHDGHHHSKQSAGEEKFYCPMHKHYSSMPCPHKHTQKEMSQPGQCKIGPECGGSSEKPAPGKSGTDENRVLENKTPSLDTPEIKPAHFFLRTTHNSPQPDSPSHPPKTL